MRAIAAGLLGALLLAAPAHATTDAQRATAVRWAVAQNGHFEHGTSNCSPLIDRWTRNMGFRTRPCRPWCGTFVHEAYRRAGVDLSQRLINPHKTYGDVLAGRHRLRRVAKTAVKPGDLLLFNFRRGVRASHIAIVRTRPDRNGRVLTAEGNVSHAVRLERRGVRHAVLAARVT